MMRKNDLRSKAAIIVTVLFFILAVFSSVFATDTTKTDKTAKSSKTVKSTKSTKTEKANTICPVMKGKITNKNNYVVYKGRTIYFCCKSCIAKFNKDPEKYMKELEKIEKSKTEDSTTKVSTKTSQKAVK